LRGEIEGHIAAASTVRIGRFIDDTCTAHLSAVVVDGISATAVLIGIDGKNRSVSTADLEPNAYPRISTVAIKADNVIPTVNCYTMNRQ
jgi:hypothetical protein